MKKAGILLFLTSITIGTWLGPQAALAVEEVSAPVQTTQQIVDKVDEKDIPVVLEEKKSSAQAGVPVGRIFLSFGVVLLLATGGFYFAKRYGRPKDKEDAATKIRVLTQHYLGPKKSLAIIRVAGESILIGVTENNINLIKPLSLIDDEVPEEIPQSFEKVLSEEEEFSISGIKEVVSNRLKDMRSF